MQAGEEGVPAANCVLEHEPKGTIPAVNLALQGMPALPEGRERLVVISMADNVIEPYQSFQGAIAAALISARENDCLISIGNPFDKQRSFDERFGHMVYRTPVEASYRTYRVDRFAEKPDRETFETLRQLPGSMAWESGAVVFRERYFRSVIPADMASGNLAEHALSRAAPWDSQTGNSLRVATSLLSGRIRFEDFGVPGQNVLDFFRGRAANDRGDGNICLGSTDEVRILACDNTLVIADERSVDVYGLTDFVVIDSIVTNTTVIMKLDDVHHLPNLYRLFLGSKKYEPYISGGAWALTAEPTTFIERSPNTRARSEYGLVFAYNFDERLTIERTRAGLTIVNDDLPKVAAEDFNMLISRQLEDPMLVKHLVNVGALAGAIPGGSLYLSDEGKQVLAQLCLYHAYGGILTPSGEDREARAIAEFERVSRLDRRMLDSSVVGALLETYNDGATHDLQLINENVNSAVAYIRQRKVRNRDLRDIVIALIQSQDNAYLYNSFRSSLANHGMDLPADEIDMIYACFKSAQIFSNGRWAWKKARIAGAASKVRQGMETARGPLEELPFVIAFIARWLRHSGINPAAYVERVNQMLLQDDSVFAQLAATLRGDVGDLICDEIYLGLINNGQGYVESIERLLAARGVALAEDAAQVFQLRQLLELGDSLGELAPYCETLSEDTVVRIREILQDFYHGNWKAIKPHVDPAILSSFLQ